MIVVFVILAALFAAFALLNRASVSINILGWPYETSVGLAVLVPLVVGLVVGYGISWGKAQQLRGLLRNAEARTRAAEAKLREQEHQREVASDEEQA